MKDNGVKSVVDGKGASGTAPNPHDLYIEIKGDYVHAQNLTDNEPLPRITPLRYTAALAYQGEKIGARVEVERVEGQSRVASNETTTAGYTFLNANLSYTFEAKRIKYDFYVRGTNLTNAEGRSHESFLKDVMPLAGRSVVFGMRMAF
jgi:iron complex outermembrane receptor protein